MLVTKMSRYIPTGADLLTTDKPLELTDLMLLGTMLFLPARCLVQTPDRWHAPKLMKPRAA